MRIVLATAVALVVATTIDLAIEAVARQAFAVSADFEPFQGTVGPYTVGGILLAAATFAVIRRFAHVPVGAFVRIAVIALVLSWIPDVALLVIREPGATIAAVGSLMFMHLVTAVIVTTLLVRVGLGRER